jgi:predicted dehydrogenase
MGSSLGVAVIGAGMAGRAHAAAYREAPTLFGAGLPDVRLVAIADVNTEFATDAARRYGFERAESDWKLVATAPDVHVVSVVVANPLHREIVEGLLEAGKHVLCEKPMAPSVADAEAMVAAAEASGRQAAVGFTFRRSPAISAIREQVRAGAIGRPIAFQGRYWCDYGVDPGRPMSWRYQGGPGSGALADVGSHILDVAQFVCGPIVAVRGAVLSTVITERAVPLGSARGHAAAAVSDVREPVENDDHATFTAAFASGATGTFAVSRVAFGHPNTLAFEVLGEAGAATFDLNRPGEFGFVDGTAPDDTPGYRQVLVRPGHPYVTGGFPMDFPGVGHGQNDFFPLQARAFLEQVAGIEGLPPCASFAEGARNLRLIDAVVASARSGGAEVAVQPAHDHPEGAP